MDNTFNIEIMMTYKCNFKCIYCYEYNNGILKADVNKNHISNETIESFILYIKNFLDNNKEKDVSIGFWGGEPTIAEKGILKIVKAFKKNDRVHFKLITNGFNLESIKKIASNIPSRRFIIQVSYDYALQTIRRIHKQSISTEMVLKNIITLLKLGYNISTKSTILLEDLDKIELVYDNFVSIKEILQKHKLNLGNLNITVDSEGKLLSDININEILIKFEHQLSNIKTKYKDSDFFNFMHENRKVCTMGTNFFVVDINGDIYPCHGMLFNSSKSVTYMGNLNEDVSKDTFKIYKLGDLYNNIPVNDNIDDCLGCDSKFCYTCQAHCFDKSTKINNIDRLFDISVDKIRCDVFKIITKYI